MKEVKAREDDYEALKMLSNKIDALPFSRFIAKRDRKLLAQGRMHVLAQNQSRRASYHRSRNEDEVQVFVFDDILVLADLTGENTKSERYIFNKSGKVLDVQEVGMNGSFSRLIISLPLSSSPHWFLQNSLCLICLLDRLLGLSFCVSRYLLAQLVLMHCKRSGYHLCGNLLRRL